MNVENAALSTTGNAVMRATNCLFCAKADALELFPERLNQESFTGYAFSARRQRQREHYRIVACATCGLVRSDPVLATESLNRLYTESRFLFADEAPFAAKTYTDLLLNLAARHGVTLGSLVEIGCSTGFFLEQARASGVQRVLGFEPSASCREHAAQTIKESILSEPFHPDRLSGERFDLACGFQVIDHVPNPLETVRALAQGLNNPGYLLLVCHDVASWSARLLGEASPIFDVEHIYLFSRATLAQLLEQAGFTVLELGSLSNTYPLGYWLRMAPGGALLGKLLPSGLARLPVTLHAGNLYAFGRRTGAEPC